MATALRRATLLLLAGLVAAVVLVWAGAIPLPPRYDPWAPLDLRDEPNFLTRFKLGRLERDPDRCFKVLADSDVQHRRLPDRPAATGCGLRDAVAVERSGVTFNRGFAATCPLGAAWALFERHALQPAARRHFGQPVARVLHLGSYACRNIGNREGSRRSEHATGNAIDVSGFVLQDGTRILVAQDWSGREDGRRGAFLKDVRDGACRFFHVVLGPDYNAAHRDHLHFDMGRFRACR